MNIREANEDDIVAISGIYKCCFPREQQHEVWIKACFMSSPKSIYYVIEEADGVKGYILWSVKNGFRSNTIVELDQIGVAPECAGQGLGKALIEESFNLFKSHVEEMGMTVKSVLVTTSKGNFAERLYEKTLGVSVEAVLKEYGSGDELILFNSNIN